MATTTNPELRVRLDPDIKERLDRFQIATRRNATQATNLLLGAALAMVETQADPDALFRTPLKENH